MANGNSWLQAPVAETALGKVRGERRNNGLAFKGIRYGADTGGKRRFLPPVAPEPWCGVMETTNFGRLAPQVSPGAAAGFEWLRSNRPMAEDCLVLNVYTPDLAGRRPVMVWLHGGAFAFGSSDAPVLDGGNLAAHGDVVVVTLNHRLNVFGYLAPLPGDERFADAGNAGMLDIVAALQWIRENIAAFGGDPESVTLFGQSGGGAKAAILMAMPQAQGLFHRAIVQSPSSGFRVQEPDDAERFATQLLACLALQPGQYAELQQIPVEQVLKAMSRVVADNGGDDHFRPVIDGRNLLAHPFYPHAPAGAAHMPMMVGYTATEATYWLSRSPANRQIDARQLHERVKRFMKLDDDSTLAVLRGYARNRPEASPADLLAYIASDHMYRLTTIEGAEQKAAQAGAPVYLYKFDWRSPMDDGFLRSPHTAEIPFVFGQVELAGDFTGGGTPDNLVLMRQMMDAWLRFARTGDPNGQGLPPWQPFSREHRATLVFNAPESSLQMDPDGSDREVMTGYRRFVPGSAVNFASDPG